MSQGKGWWTLVPGHLRPTPQTVLPPSGNDVAFDSTGKLVKGLSLEVVKEHSQDGLEGRSANQGLWALRSPPAVFVNKVLWEPNHTYLFACCPRLLSSYNSMVM